MESSSQTVKSEQETNLQLNEANATQLKQSTEAFTSICSEFTTEAAQEMANDERLLRFGEVEFAFTPFVYGEIRHESISEFLLWLKQEHGLFAGEEQDKVFYDLGAGIGKPSVTAAVTLNKYFKKCVGIELLDSLHDKSQELKKKYDETVGDSATELTFEKFDFLEESDRWVQDADLIFVNATCFDQEMVDKISAIVEEKLKVGGVFILTTKELKLSKTESFKLIGPVMKEMSWGHPTPLRAYVKL